MTVKELREKLGTFPEDADIVFLDSEKLQYHCAKFNLFEHKEWIWNDIERLTNYITKGEDPRDVTHTLYVELD